MTSIEKLDREIEELNREVQQLREIAERCSDSADALWLRYREALHAADDAWRIAHQTVTRMHATVEQRLTVARLLRETLQGEA
jgi:predicted RNase H-like nuclease (RuvC/YqgF family)